MHDGSGHTYYSNKILIVDDDRTNSLLLSTILKREGYEQTTFVHCGFEGLREMGITDTRIDAKVDQKSPFDLVLLDIILPDINGFEVCQRLREVLGDEIAIILITGFDIEQQHARYVESGADDFLLKPINSKELVNRVKLHLSKLERRRGAESIKISSDLEVKSIGGYRIVKTLSWSGSVVVYLAERVGEKVVIKILTKQAMEYHDVRERFQREADLLKVFDHPNIVKMKGSGTYHGLAYFVTEYLEGENLEDFALENNKPPFDTVTDIALAVAQALDHIHSKGVVHRDVKLKNTFINTDGSIKVGDFGIALTKQAIRLTQPGYAIGTPIYMAPEQFKGGEVTPKIDIYSFGASMYHLTTGLPPFAAGCAVELLRKHATSTPTRMSSFRDDLPPAWDELIIDKCMAKDPADRPESMADVVQAITAIANRKQSTST